MRGAELPWAAEAEASSFLGRLARHVVCRQALQPRRTGKAPEPRRPAGAEPGRLAVERIAQQSADAPRLLLELLEHPLTERRALLAKEPRFRSAPLAALVIDQARRRPEQAEPLACTAVLILDETGEEGRGLRVSAKVTLAEVLRGRGDLEEAEAALLSAQEDLRHEAFPWEAAELCAGLARLRREQARSEEAFALIERAARLFGELSGGDEEASAWLEAARWHAALGAACEAALHFSMALQVKASEAVHLAAIRGLVQQLVLRGESELASEFLEEAQRLGGFATAPAAVLQSLAGRLRLQRAEVEEARSLLEDAFASLLSSELRADALIAGLALLVAGAPPAEVAPRLVGLVPPLWQGELAGLLEEVASSGQVRPEQLATLERFLDLPEKPQ